MPLSSLAPSFSFFVCVFFFFSPFVFVLLFVVCCFFFVSFSFSFSFSAVAASPHRALLNPTPIFPSHESAISCAVVMKAEMQPATAADGASSNQQQPTTTTTVHTDSRTGDAALFLLLPLAIPLPPLFSSVPFPLLARHCTFVLCAAFFLESVCAAGEMHVWLQGISLPFPLSLKYKRGREKLLRIAIPLASHPVQTRQHTVSIVLCVFFPFCFLS